MSRTNELTQFILEFLEEKGWLVWRNNSGSVKSGQYMIQLSPAYTGDIIGMDPQGRYVHIEVKTDNDILSQGQTEMLWRVASSTHGICCVARTQAQFLRWFQNCRKLI